MSKKRDQLQVVDAEVLPALQMQIVKAEDIDHLTPDGLESVFANHFVIQNVGGTFSLKCYQLQPPEFFRLGDMNKKQQLEAKCKAVITIPADQFVALAKAMQEHISKLRR